MILYSSIITYRNVINAGALGKADVTSFMNCLKVIFAVAGNFHEEMEMDKVDKYMKRLKVSKYRNKLINLSCTEELVICVKYVNVLYMKNTQKMSNKCLLNLKVLWWHGGKLSWTDVMAIKANQKWLVMWHVFY